MNINPAKETVILKNVSRQKTASGLDLPTTTSQNKPETGIVVAVGEGEKPVEFAIGDTVVYRKYTDNEVQVGTEKFNFISFKDIVGVIGK